jgi:hypothetical protein
MYCKLLGLFVAVASVGFSYEDSAVVRKLFVQASEKYEAVIDPDDDEGSVQDHATDAFAQFESIIQMADPKSPAYFSSMWKAVYMGMYLDESYNEKTAHLIKKIILQDPIFLNCGLQMISRIIPEHVEWNLEEETLTLAHIIAELEQDGVDFNNLDLDTPCLQFVEKCKELIQEGQLSFSDDEESKD